MKLRCSSHCRACADAAFLLPRPTLRPQQPVCVGAGATGGRPNTSFWGTISADILPVGVLGHLRVLMSTPEWAASDQDLKWRGMT